MGARRKFCRGGGTQNDSHKDNKAPHLEKKVSTGPHMVKKAPHNKKNVEKGPPI